MRKRGNSSRRSNCFETKRLQNKFKINQKRTGKTFWRGRLQVVKQKPLVILDSAHNPDGWDKLFESIKIFNFEKMFVVFGTMNDKETEKAKKHLKKANLVFLTKSDSFRAEEPKNLLKKIGFGKIVLPEKKALKEAISAAGKKDLVLVTGSIYLVGKAHKFFN